MRDQVIDGFRAVFGTGPQYVAHAPGRANLIGEHTDYHEGFAMPLAVDRAVWVAFSPTDDALLTVHTLDFGHETTTVPLDALQTQGYPHWTDYVRGAWWLMRSKGHQPGGVQMVIGSDVPLGGGMSSSAAIGVAMVETVAALLRLGLSPQEKARHAAHIENDFIGMPSGLLDQMASVGAVEGAAMLLDCRDLSTQAVPLPQGVQVVVMNTLKSRELTESGYADRRRESETAAQVLGVSVLRDASLEMIEAQRDELGEVGYRRARHIITENARTLAMQTALGQGDLSEAATLLNASHASLRDDYNVSVRELDVMSELARTHPACYGARMMGGGFGGCCIGLVNSEHIDPFLSEIGAKYAAATNLTPEFYVCRPSAGSAITRLT